MKQLLILLTISSIFVISSCKEDDTVETLDVLGEWALEDYKELDGKFMVKGEIFSTFDRQSNNESGSITFLEDGTYNSNYGYHLTTNTNTAGYQKAVKSVVSATPTSGTYSFSLEDSTLALAGGSNAGEYKVIEISETKLLLNFDASAPDTLADSPGIMEGKGVILFSK